MNDRTSIPIFFTFDDRYVIPAAVAFFTLLKRAKPGCRYRLHVLHHDITPGHRRLLEEIVGKSGNGSLSFLDTGDFLRKEWENGAWEGNQGGCQFTSDAVVRCFGARFFPQYDKIVYSDVDVVFKDDISELWDVDVSDVYLAGVRNAFMRANPHELSHLSAEDREMLKDSYLAGGIWVMNLKKIREDGLEGRMMEIIRDDRIVKRWNDQDVVNIACAGRVAFLPLNYIAYPYLADKIRDEAFESHFSRRELYESVIFPKILHYAALKPWAAEVPYGEDWWTVYDYLFPEGNLKRPESRVCRRLIRMRWALVFMVLLFLIIVTWSVVIGGLK